LLTRSTQTLKNKSGIYLHVVVVSPRTDHCEYFSHPTVKQRPTPPDSAARTGVPGHIL